MMCKPNVLDVMSLDIRNVTVYKERWNVDRALNTPARSEIFVTTVIEVDIIPEIVWKDGNDRLQLILMISNEISFL